MVYHVPALSLSTHAVGLALMGCLMTGCGSTAEPAPMDGSGEDVAPPDGGEILDSGELPARPDDATDTAAAAEDTGSPPVVFVAPPDTCDPPPELGVDPLGLTGTAIPSLDGQSGADRKHLVNITFDAPRQRVYAAGIPALAIHTPLDGVPVFQGSLNGNTQHVITLDDGLVAVTKRGGPEANGTTNANVPIEPGTLVIADATDPLAITVVSETLLDGASGLAYRDDHLYLLNHGGELQVWSVEDPAAPTMVGVTAELGNPWEVVLLGPLAYVADNTKGLVVVDVRDPMSPHVLSSVATSGGAQDLDLEDDTLWVAVGSAGVEAFSLAIPSAPTWLSVTDVGGAAISVAASGDYVWTVDQVGVAVLDGSDPTSPLPLAIEATPSWAMHVHAEGTRAYVADWNAVSIYDLDDTHRAPHADVEQKTLYFTGGDQVTEFKLTNRGGDTLDLHGMRVDDPRFTVEVSALSAAPGETITARVSFTDDGEEVQTTLCLSSNDPDTPVRKLTVASTSAGGTNVLVGEPAPDFNLPSIDGNPYLLSDALGYPVVLCYFATW